MALVIVSGLACSGKSRRSQELQEDFLRRTSESISGSGISNGTPLRVVRLCNKDVNIRPSQFSTQKLEKPARAAYLSLVTRSLSRSTLVVADGGAGTNIKGFRYQMWCAARETGVRCISIFCVASKEVCKKRNDQRIAEGDEQAYDEETLNELLMRFEEPNAMTRWDSPLFVIDCNPTEAENEDSWEKLPLDAIWEAMTEGKVTKAPDVVAPSRATTSNYLSLMETTTQLVLSSYQALAAFGNMPDTGGLVQLSVTLPDSTSTTQMPLQLPVGQKTPTTAALQRLRRQFVKLHASGAISGNELGHALSQEGRVSSFTSEADTRASRKTEQSNKAATKRANSTTKPSSTEEEIARRFITYLEVTL